MFATSPNLFIFGSGRPGRDEGGERWMMMTCWWNGFRMARMSTPHDDDDDGEVG